MTPAMQPFYLGDIIKKELANKSLRKGEKTKLKLMLGTIKMLGKVTFKQLRIADICKEAKVSYGVFYHYHKDKVEVTSLLIEMFIQEFNSRFSYSEVTDDHYYNIFMANYYYIGCFKYNAGLIQVIISNHEEMPNLIDKYNELALIWHERVAKALPNDLAGLKVSEDEKLFIAYSLGGMLDELLRQINILKNPNLKAFENTKDITQITQLLSILWYRAVYGKDPSQQSQKLALKTFS
ncbi:MAG: hypothetical protein DRQ47_08520 [Gammaproteobacteria bacterium]|nr:MAG: hypothetical protein DRQ47_08520 [Gammaproteobacteria bacterium]